MAVKKKKRLGRAGASPEELASSPEVTESDTDTGAEEKPAKKPLKKKVATPKPVVAESDDDSEWELEETDRNIVNTKQFISIVVGTGVDEMTVNRFWMNNSKVLVATVDQQSATITKVEIEPTEFGQELAEALWDAVEGEGQDPATVNVAEDGWHYQYEIEF